MSQYEHRGVIALEAELAFEFLWIDRRSALLDDDLADISLPEPVAQSLEVEGNDLVDSKAACEGCLDAGIM